MKTGQGKRLTRIVVTMLLCFCLGAFAFSDPVGMHRHDAVAHSEKQIRNGFIGLGIGLIILLGIDIFDKKNSATIKSNHEKNEAHASVKYSLLTLLLASCLTLSFFMGILFIAEFAVRPDGTVTYVGPVIAMTIGWICLLFYVIKRALRESAQSN